MWSNRTANIFGKTRPALQEARKTLSSDSCFCRARLDIGLDQRPHRPRRSKRLGQQTVRSAPRPKVRAARPKLRSILTADSHGPWAFVRGLVTRRYGLASRQPCTVATTATPQALKRRKKKKNQKKKKEKKSKQKEKKKKENTKEKTQKPSGITPFFGSFRHAPHLRRNKGRFDKSAGNPAHACLSPPSPPPLVSSRIHHHGVASFVAHRTFHVASEARSLRPCCPQNLFLMVRSPCLGAAQQAPCKPSVQARGRHQPRPGGPKPALATSTGLRVFHGTALFGRVHTNAKVTADSVIKVVCDSAAVFSPAAHNPQRTRDFPYRPMLPGPILSHRLSGSGSPKTVSWAASTRSLSNFRAGFMLPTSGHESGLISSADDQAYIVALSPRAFAPISILEIHQLDPDASKGPTFE